MPYAIACIDYLKTHGKNVAFISNNASRSRIHVTEKFAACGFSSISPNEVNSYCESVGLFCLLCHSQIHKDEMSFNPQSLLNRRKRI